MAFFVLTFLTPLILAIGFIIYWFIISIKDRDFVDAAFSLAIIMFVIGAIGMLLG